VRNKLPTSGGQNDSSSQNATVQKIFSSAPAEIGGKTDSASAGLPFTRAFFQAFFALLIRTAPLPYLNYGVYTIIIPLTLQFVNTF
jgi:hypothetical protein